MIDPSRPLSPTMQDAIKQLDNYFKSPPGIYDVLILGGGWCDVSTSTIHALARRGCCRVTVQRLKGGFTEDVITRENWLPGILDRMANI